jgi:hypothetical protein
MSLAHRTRPLRPRASLFLGPLFLALTTAHLLAQAGPPFRSDDPETPGNKHWEINLGWIGDRNPYEGYYSVPVFDINYGLGDRVQLKYELPVAIHELRGGLDNAGEFTPPSQAHVDIGLGESLLGIKWRFYQHLPPTRKNSHRQEKRRPTHRNPPSPSPFIRNSLSITPPVPCATGSFFRGRSFSFP